MTKIAYNACHGGFSISDAALKRYAEMKGITLYPEYDARFRLTTYWTIPEEARAGKVLQDDAWYAAPMEARAASNKFCKDNQINTRDFERDDALLIQVIEELGDAANGAHAKLRISDLPAGSRYRIDEYDGFESVETPDSDEWKTAS